MLSTTSYAVLGMLAVRPWSAYDLTKQMRRSLVHCWPKAESVLYDEPKRLVRLGLATATDEPSGQAGARSRAVYSITDDGRAALREWLSTAPAEPRLEIEPLLRLLYADHGRPEDLLRALATVRQWAQQRVADGLTQNLDYREAGGPFPDRLPLLVLFGDLVTRLFDAFDSWAADAATDVARWPSTAGPDRSPRTDDLLDQIIARMQTTLARQPSTFAAATGTPDTNKLSTTPPTPTT